MKLETAKDSLEFAYRVIMERIDDGVMVKGMMGDFFFAVMFLFLVYLAMIWGLLPSSREAHQTIKKAIGEYFKEMEDEL